MNRRILKKKFKTRWRESMAELSSKAKGFCKVKPSRIKVSEEFGENEIIIKGTWHQHKYKIKFYHPTDNEDDKVKEKDENLHEFLENLEDDELFALQRKVREAAEHE